MRYTVRKSIVSIVGRIWMPSVVCGQTKTLSSYDVKNARDDDGAITRDSVEQWLCTNSGDFRDIIDFSASIEDGEHTIDIPFATEDGESQFLDAMSGGDE